MSRLEEVEAAWDHWGCMKTPNAVMVLALDQARTLAGEADELQRRCAALKQEITYWKRGNISCAAANATLDALRKAFGKDRPFLYCLNCDDYHENEDPESGECLDCGGDITSGSRLLQAAYDILYPQPAALAEEKTNGN